MSDRPPNSSQSARESWWLWPVFAFAFMQLAATPPNGAGGCSNPAPDNKSSPVSSSTAASDFSADGGVQAASTTVLDIRLESAASVPDQEKVQRSAVIVVRARGQTKEVVAKLEESRDSGEVDRFNCINERLSQMKGLLRVIEGDDLTLQENIAKKDSSAANQVFSTEMLASQREDGLRAEVEQCIGELAYQTGVQTVEFEIPANLPGDDVTQRPRFITILVRPPPASPM